MHLDTKTIERQIKQMHNGLIAATANHVAELMPAVVPLIQDFFSFAEGQEDMRGITYRFDVKVHMLMPKQFPCIPGWHCDFVPRDESGTKRPEWIDNEAPPMAILLSGPPFTEWADGTQMQPWTWKKFDQRMLHRGTEADAFGWRLFVRAVPSRLVPHAVKKIAGLRRHSQVYIDKDFEW